jgi:hypothetical protein
MLEVLRLGELLGLGILDTRPHQSGERLVVVFVPDFLELSELSCLRCIENQRKTVCVDGGYRARFQSEVGSNTTTVALKLDEPSVEVVAFKVGKSILKIVFGGHLL